MRGLIHGLLAAGVLLGIPGTVLAAEGAPAVDTGDTAWVLISAALVMLMTPGLAFFYGGMVRSKNVLTTIMQSFFIVAMVSVQWVLFGFSLDFWLLLLGGGTVCPTLGSRILFFALGEGVTALAVAFYFRTSLPLQIYERLVTAFASCYHIPTDRMKLINDVAMLLLSLLLALTLNRSLDGVGLGTVVITAVNAPLIGLSGRLLDRFFRFDPRFPRLCACLAGEE